jgi:hypothetical protein
MRESLERARNEDAFKAGTASACLRASTGVLLGLVPVANGAVKDVLARASGNGLDVLPLFTGHVASRVHQGRANLDMSDEHKHPAP